MESRCNDGCYMQAHYDDHECLLWVCAACQRVK